MTKIKIGDLVSVKTDFGHGPIDEGVIERIELLEPDQRDGIFVESAILVQDRSLVVYLDNGHWAYGFQILE